MSNIQPTINKYSQSEGKKSQIWEERKTLIIQINPKVEAIFQKTDSDYLEMFNQLGTFKFLPQDIAFHSSLDEARKYFFEKNYQKILIHFFQYLFDFELQTLQFEEKHETILSFGQWIENDVTFEMPDKINFVNKKKPKIQPIILEQSTNIKSKSNLQFQNTQILKRERVEQVQQKQQKYIKKISSPVKKKIIEKQDDGMIFMDFTSKYQESTNNTMYNNIPNTPRQSSGQKEILIQKLQAKPAIPHNNQSKRKIFKVNDSKKSQSQKSQGKEQTKNKQATRKSKQKSQSKQKNLSKKNKKTDLSKISEHEVIILETSEQDKQKCEKPPKNSTLQTDLLALQISGQDPLRDSVDKRSQISNSKVGSITSRQDFQVFDLDISRKVQSQSPQKEKIKNRKKSEQKEFLNVRHIMQEIAMDERKKIQNQIIQNGLSEQKKILRKSHAFRARLSGLFRYSQKRYYIFPDMAPNFQEETKPKGSEQPISSKNRSNSASKTVYKKYQF